jgi:hypothetical protein
MFRSKKYILVVSNVGQANEQRLKFLLEEVYRIKGKEYQRNEDEYESEKYLLKIYLNTDGENLDKNEIMENKSKIKAIICLENLNPRSNSLKDNLEQLRQVFTSNELWKKLYVFFSFGTSTTPSNLDKLREDVLDFNEMYKLIGLFDRISINKKRLRIFCCLFSSCVSARCCDCVESCVTSCGQFCDFDCATCYVSCCVSGKPDIENDTSSLIRHSGIKSRAQADCLSDEDVKILRKENCLKIKFNSKRVWILDEAHILILRKIKF